MHVRQYMGPKYMHMHTERERERHTPGWPPPPRRHDSRASTFIDLRSRVAEQRQIGALGGSSSNKYLVTQAHYTHMRAYPIWVYLYLYAVYRRTHTHTRTRASERDHRNGKQLMQITLSLLGRRFYFGSLHVGAAGLAHRRESSRDGNDEDTVLACTQK